MLQSGLDGAPPPHEAHRLLSQRHPTTFILESRDGPERLARYSFVGWAPSGIITLDEDGLKVSGDAPRPKSREGVIPYLRRVLELNRTDDRDTPFVGGLVGMAGYDLVREFEPSLPRGPDGPRLALGLYLDCLVYDHQAGTCTYVSRGPDRREDLAEIPGMTAAPRKAGAKAPKSDASPSPSRASLKVGKLTASTDRSTFVGQVARAKELITAGECFQIVLSRSYTGPYRGDLGECYDWMRDNLRVPYLYHLRFAGSPARSLLGASPEMLVRVRDGVAETVPIAGTRARTGDAKRDAAAAKDLLADPKERAEHAMLVDLARNDLGRVSNPGTVKVEEYAKVAAFGPVQHLVTRVTGELAEGKDSLDALSAIFPAGTVSGAPKLRAIEHIDALEARSRGPYAGCVLYVSFNGDLDSAITIRSLSATDGSLVVQAGAGIVAGSDPQSEFEETRKKASTILAGLQTFGATLPAETA